jgi:hypothetical protein
MSRTLEQAIIWYEQFANACRYYNLTESQEEFEQLTAWLRELAERRKAPEIVHCGECARRKTMCDGRDRCAVFNVFVDSDGYYKWAERRTE